VIVDPPSVISRISLERPASIRRHLPLASHLGWLLPEFLVGPENQTLRFLFDQASIGKLEQLSPIVLYGDKEVGKTALSITLAVTWARLTSLRPLCFTTGREFASDYGAAVEIDDVASFRQRHRTCKLLLIDDLEGLASAPASQGELVSTLDVMQQNNQPVIVTVHRLPSTVTGLCSALASRLAGGLSVPLSKPLSGTLQELVPALVQHIDPQLPSAQLVDVCLKFSSRNLSAVDVQKVVTIAAQNKHLNGSVDLEIVPTPGSTIVFWAMSLAPHDRQSGSPQNASAISRIERGHATGQYRPRSRLGYFVIP
jgi:chromosomal replication initiation ATPase DnaA